MADDLLRELLSDGRDTPTSQLSFTANENPEDEKLAKEVMRKIANAMSSVNKWRSACKEDDRFYYGHQWQELDKMRMESLRRPALTYNEIGPKIDAISGIERMNRTEVRFQSRPLDSDIAHDAAGDLATESVACVEDMCDGEIEDSEAIKDCLKGGMGWVEILMEYLFDEDGQVIKRKIDNKEMVWDTKARKPNIADRKWHARIKDYSRKDFKKRWPGKADMVDQASVFYQEDAIEKYELVTPYYSTSNERANPAIDQQPATALANIPVIQYQWIDEEPVWRMANPAEPDKLVSLSEEQWDAIKKKAELTDSPPPKAVRQLKGTYKQVYVALGVILEEKVVIPDFTFKPITGLWDSEKKVWYGLVRGLKDPQSTENKAISSLVTQYITNAKGGVIFKTGTFADSAMAKNQWAQPDAWIEANREADLQKDIMPRQPAQVSDFPQLLFTQSREAITRSSGVNDEMVGVATGEQSGPAIDKRQQGGLAILGWLWDSITKYKKDVAHTELEFIREYWSHGQYVNVGGDFNSKSIPLLQSDLPIAYNMVMDQSVRYNPNLKARIWEQLVQMAQPLLKLPAGQQILLKGMKFSEFPAQLVQEIQQAVAEAPPPPQKGRQAAPGKPPEDPNFTQAKIRKMDAETQRTMAETRKLDKEGHLGVAQLAVDAITKGAEHRHKTVEHQHKVLSERQKMAQDFALKQQQAQQAALQAQQQPQQPQQQPTNGAPQQ